jgi:hypothetical protein
MGKQYVICYIFRWLGVSRQFVTPEEFEATRDAVACFRKTDGPKLQAYLAQK